MVLKTVITVQARGWNDFLAWRVNHACAVISRSTRNEADGTFQATVLVPDQAAYWQLRRREHWWVKYVSNSEPCDWRGTTLAPSAAPATATLPATSASAVTV